MVKEMGGEFFAGFNRKVQAAMLSYPWPGNVRELKNVVERAVYQHGDKPVKELVFDPFASPWRPASAAPDGGGNGKAADAVRSEAPDLAQLEQIDFRSHMQDYERQLLRRALQQNQFNQRKTAEFLKLSYDQLRGYMRKYDLTAQ